MAKNALMRALANGIAFAVAVGVWWWAWPRSFDVGVSVAFIVGGPLGIFPLAWLCRRLLDATPTPERTFWASIPMHYGVLVLISLAAIESYKLILARPVWVIPLPAWIGYALMMIAGAFVLLTVLNLALRGLGAPFAIALTRRLSVDWLYRWTRNPMVLGALAFMVAGGLWMRSAWFVLWVILLFAPAMIFFLKVYEERELEIRFGEPYLDYKARTPFLFPGRPREPLGRDGAQQT
jgi:protein-S-isoprenylcysteine O-methyltransferase Ste14